MSAPDAPLDYYALLDVDRTADDGAISHAVRAQRRRWVSRQNSPSVAKQREAEDRLETIGLAEHELLDPNKRREYDARLRAAARARSTSAGSHSVPAPPPMTNWMARAEEELTRGDLRAARYAAREATESCPRDDAAWAMRAMVSKASGRWEDAFVELTEALKFGRRPGYYAQLGEIHQTLGQWDDAAAAFQAAGELDPNDPGYDLAAAQVWLGQYRPDLALPILQSLHLAHPQNQNINQSLANALLGGVDHYLTALHDGSVLFTSVTQIDRARADLQRALSLPFQDDILRSQLGARLAQGEKSALPAWNLPRGAWRWVGWAVACWVALAFPMSAAKPDALGVLIGFISLAGVLWGFVKLHRKPLWQRNVAQYRQLVSRWGS